MESKHTAVDTLVHVLQRHARQRPDHRAFVYLRDDESEEVVMTYAQLDERARRIAAHLQQMHLVGERVLLAFPPGLDLIAGYFGCLYAGCVAVPVSLPRKRTLDRFGEIAADAGARLILSTTPAIAQFHEVIRRLDQANVASQIPWLAVDDMVLASPDQWTRPEISSEALAMLQYTSGSTSQPKGVMISHGNLIQNTRDIHQAFEMNREVSVFWLPTHHDMGLVGGILEPIYAGTMSVLMAPSSFLQHPYAWLAAISTYRATITGAPNFAYDLCVRKITDEQRATLDLSCLSLAFIGAEPIQPETLERFTAAFAPCGFDPAAFYPCYGLAEATLMVSGAKRSKCSHNRHRHRRRPRTRQPALGRPARKVRCGLADVLFLMRHGEDVARGDVNEGHEFTPRIIRMVIRHRAPSPYPIRSPRRQLAQPLRGQYTITHHHEHLALHHARRLGEPRRKHRVKVSQPMAPAVWKTLLKRQHRRTIRRFDRRPPEVGQLHTNRHFHRIADFFRGLRFDLHRNRPHGIPRLTPHTILLRRRRLAACRFGLRPHIRRFVPLRQFHQHRRLGRAPPIPRRISRDRAGKLVQPVPKRPIRPWNVRPVVSSLRHDVVSLRLTGRKAWRQKGRRACVAVQLRPARQLTSGRPHMPLCLHASMPSHAKSALTAL
ncbi:MAG: fatty acyl-AMP ligase [Phycisphaerales bacterium]|nr:MAG: fatty acyl-AMP ligase [Phycisphaerales bacterium]